MNVIAAGYGMAAYLVFLVTFLYVIGFVGGVLVPKTIDAGIPAGAAGEPVFVSVIVDVSLLALFALQHSVMARPAFKRWWTRWVPAAMERSTYVLLASAALIVLVHQWRPIEGVVWNLSGGASGVALGVSCALGWALVLASTFQIDHFELFGLKQAFSALTGRTLAAPVFKLPLLYRYVRHPIYLGFLLAFWSTPVMTGGHLLFAIGMTAYILVGIWFEERDLMQLFGERYRDYRGQVGMLLPRRLGRAPANTSRSGSGDVTT
jgi:protein-S-isoprenylcysteine O-methyltransferase Ste14